MRQLHQVRGIDAPPVGFLRRGPLEDCDGLEYVHREASPPLILPTHEATKHGERGAWPGKNPSRKSAGRSGQPLSQGALTQAGASPGGTAKIRMCPAWCRPSTLLCHALATA